MVVVAGSYRPLLNWADIARTLRDRPALQSVPIIAIGFEPEEQAQLSAERSGVDAYCPLPFPPLRLLKTAEELLLRSRSHAA